MNRKWIYAISIIAVIAITVAVALITTDLGGGNLPSASVTPPLASQSASLPPVLTTPDPSITPTPMAPPPSSASPALSPTPPPSTTPRISEDPSPTPTPKPSGSVSAMPSATPPASTSKPPASNLSYEEEVVRFVNEARIKAGLSTLTLDTSLSGVARAKSQDMHDKKYFSHTSPTYGSPFDMMTTFGISYKAAAENIAQGYNTPAAVMDGWMNSPGHKANILGKSYTKIGVGYVSDGHYWTQLFIG